MELLSNKKIVNCGCRYNDAKVYRFRRTRCGHYYQQQTIDGHILYSWRRTHKKTMLNIMAEHSYWFSDWFNGYDKPRTKEDYIQVFSI